MSDHLLKIIVSQVWQIALLTAAVAFITRIFAKNRPHLAHALWILVLVKCVTPPVWSHSLSPFSQLQAMWLSTDATKDTMPVSKAVPPKADDETQAVLSTALLTIPSKKQTHETNLPGHSARLTTRGTVPTGNLTEIAMTELAASSHHRYGKAYLGPVRSGMLLTIAAIGASITLITIVVRYVRCVRLINQHRTTEFDDRIQQHVQNLSERLRLRRAPRVIVSSVLFGPAVLGLIRQTIVLPRCLLELPNHEVQPGRQDLRFLDPILAHELLHIRRGDLITGALQIIVRSLWWFHPAVWLCSRCLSREAERCCDEQVIAELRCSPAQYARSLLSVIETKHRLHAVPIFPGMTPVEITTQRMERIMSLKSNVRKQTPMWCWLATAILAVFVLPGAAAQVTIDQKIEADEKLRSRHSQPDVQEVQKDEVGRASESTRPSPFDFMTYSIADLVAPTREIGTKAEYLPIIELIKSSIEPDSWSGESGQITFAEPTLSLVIRQTPEVHQQIAQLLSQLRNDQTQIQISAQILKITTDSQLQGLKSRCSLHPQTMSASTQLLQQKQHWALLTPARSEQLLKFLNDEKAEPVSRPKILTISDQSAFVEVGSNNAGQFHGYRLDVKPHHVTGSSLIRLSHSVQIGDIDLQRQPGGELSLEESLDKRISLQFHEAPLTDVLRHIATTHNVNITFKSRVLSTESLPATQRVSIDVDGVTLREALKMLLNQAGELSFSIENHVLVISDQPKQEASPTTSSGAPISESLMSSGQTLLLLTEPALQSATDETPEPSQGRFVILLTAEILREQESNVN